MEDINNSHNDYANRMQLMGKLRTTDFLKVKILSLLSAIGYLIALCLDLTHMEWEASAATSIGEIPEIITWFTFIGFLKKFTGTKEITRALKIMILCFLGMIVAAFINGLLFYSEFADLSAFPLLIVSIAYWIFYLKSGLRMSDMEEGILDLKALGKTIVYCVTIGVLVNITKNVFADDIGTAGLRVALIIVCFTSITPFLILFRALAKAEKVILTGQ